ASGDFVVIGIFAGAGAEAVAGVELEGDEQAENSTTHATRERRFITSSIAATASMIEADGDSTRGDDSPGGQACWCLDGHSITGPEPSRRRRTGHAPASTARRRRARVH